MTCLEASRVAHAIEAVYDRLHIRFGNAIAGEDRVMDRLDVLQGGDAQAANQQLDVVYVGRAPRCSAEAPVTTRCGES